MMAVKEWMLKRGILYGLTQAPILAVAGGFFFKWLPFPIMNFAVMFGFLVLPAWISWRKKVSTDPTEPAHHMHRYALYALLPYVVFSVVRVPTTLLFKFPYWHPWFEFGTHLTGQPGNEYASLIPGAFLYTMQGYSLGLGYYLLFQRHTLTNAVLYLCIFLSSFYAYLFPEFGRAGMPSTPLWHAVNWWAHLSMAITAWYAPILFGKKWPQFGLTARRVAGGAAVLAFATPYAFAFWRTAVWQFPAQYAIDEKLFSRTSLVQLQEPLTLVSSGDETKAIFTLRFGSRLYKNYINKVKAIEAKQVRVQGRIFEGNKIAGWCSAELSELPSPTQFEHTTLEYASKIKEFEYADIQVDCVGPAHLANRLKSQAQVALQWKVSAILVGDREQRLVEFKGRSASKSPELAGREVAWTR